MSSRKIAYFTDVEGQWSKVEGFLAGNPWVTLGPGDRLEVAEGAVMIFGGDAVDRGPNSQRIVAALLDVKRRQPSQVVLLSGNRDINKLRLRTELSGQPHHRAPEELRAGPRPALLRWIFDVTMNAPNAFRFRAEELAARGEAHDDEAVVESFIADAQPDGLMAAYLGACQLAHREGENLFVHGGVTSDSLGHVPGEAARRGDVQNVDGWCEGLNAFYARQCEAFLDPTPQPREAYAPVVAYQAPIPGTRQNRASVVYGRTVDADGTPALPEPETVRALRRDGINRLVVGHTPSGDCPAMLRDGQGFEMIFADNSYGRIEPGCQLFLDEEPRFTGETLLDGGERVAILTHLREGAGGDGDSPLGLRDAAGRLVKSRLTRGDYLLYRQLPAHKCAQLTARGEAVPRPLRPPF